MVAQSPTYNTFVYFRKKHQLQHTTIKSKECDVLNFATTSIAMTHLANCCISISADIMCYGLVSIQLASAMFVVPPKLTCAGAFSP